MGVSFGSGITPFAGVTDREGVTPSAGGAGQASITRYFTQHDPVTNTHYTLQNTVTLAGDFDVSSEAILPTAATTYALLGQAASASNSLRLLSTGFVSVVIGGLTVTSTVTATKDSKLRAYGVKLIGNDFIFTEDGATIDTVVDATAAANSLVIDAIAQSNGLNFFDGIMGVVNLEDITTPSNSESWQLNNKPGVTTEQSSSGSNLLTSVNVVDGDKELFTLDSVDNQWEGVDLFTGFTNFGVGWADIGGQVYTCDGTQVANTFIFSTLTQVSGRTYVAEFATVVDVGQIRVEGTGSTAKTVSGSYKENFTALTTNFTMFGNSTYEGNVSLIALKRTLRIA